MAGSSDPATLAHRREGTLEVARRELQHFATAVAFRRDPLSLGHLLPCGLVHVHVLTAGARDGDEVRMVMAQTLGEVLRPLTSPVWIWHQDPSVFGHLERPPRTPALEQAADLSDVLAQACHVLTQPSHSLIERADISSDGTQVVTDARGQVGDVAAEIKDVGF